MINSIIHLLDRHFENTIPIYEEIRSWDNIGEKIFDDWYKRSIIDAFAFNFIRIQDIMSNKLFKYTLNLIGEYKNNMPFIDVINKMEKLELIKDANNWKNYRLLRNNLTHEYPDDHEDIIVNLNQAILAYKNIKKIYQNIKNYISKYEDK
jgi:uncharacterized protein with HEPN domain